MIENYDSVDVFVGVDVGKGEHHAVALNRAGKVVFDKALPNDENKMRAVLQTLKQHGIVLVVVDQPATIGALPIAVAQAESVLVGYLPGLAMRRIADLHAGEAKTDARDAAIIAQAARTLPHALRSIQLADESIAELSMLCGFDDDILGQMTATSNRIRGLLTQIHPALERVVGPHLDHPAMLDLLQHYPSPAAMKTAGTTRMATRLLKLAPRMGRRLAEEITQALSEQTVVVVGTNAAATVLPRLAEQLAALRRQRTEIAVVVEKLVEDHPLSPVLTSMPGVGVRTAARLLTEVAGKHFETAGHLAAYVSIRPGEATRSSNGPSSSPLSRRYVTQSREPTTTARSPKENATTKPSSPSPDAAATSSTPCSATGHFMKPNTNLLLDKPHRGTPRTGVEQDCLWLRDGPAATPSRGHSSC
jgi:transposase